MNRIVKIFLIVCFLFSTITGRGADLALASDIVGEVTLLSGKGELLVVKFLIKGEEKEEISVEIGSTMDYRLLNVAPPSFLDQLKVTLTNRAKKGFRIAYIESTKPIRASTTIPLVLKIFKFGTPVLEKIDIDLSRYSPVAPARSKKEAQKKSQSKNIRDIVIFVNPTYRFSNRDMKVGTTGISSEVSLAMVRFELSSNVFKKHKERLGIFFDLGSGILKLKDSLLFSSLSAPVSLTKYDGGRGLLYGGGVKVSLFEKDAFSLGFSGGVLRFATEADSTTLKVMNTTAEASWIEYGAELVASYAIKPFLSPYFGLIYSETGGELTLTQILGGSSSSEKMDFDEDSSLGIVLGVRVVPIERLGINLATRLVNETGFLVSLEWEF